MTSHNENTDEDPLDVEMSGDFGKPVGVALVLEKAAEFMREMDEDLRFDFELEIQECERDG
jgi:hypothetical protein